MEYLHILIFTFYIFKPSNAVIHWRRATREGGVVVISIRPQRTTVDHNDPLEEGNKGRGVVVISIRPQWITAYHSDVIM